MSDAKKFTRKHRITQCKEVFEQLREDCFIPTIENTYNYNTVCRIKLPKLKKAATNIVSEQFIAKVNKRANDAPFQGEF